MPETVRLIATRSDWSSFLEQNDQSAAVVIMASYWFVAASSTLV
jgi:hypothetical protein